MCLVRFFYSAGYSRSTFWHLINFWHWAAVDVCPLFAKLFLANRCIYHHFACRCKTSYQISEMHATATTAAVIVADNRQYGVCVCAVHLARCFGRTLPLHTFPSSLLTLFEMKWQRVSVLLSFRLPRSFFELGKCWCRAFYRNAKGSFYWQWLRRSQWLYKYFIRKHITCCFVCLVRDRQVEKTAKMHGHIRAPELFYPWKRTHTPNMPGIECRKENE